MLFPKIQTWVDQLLFSYRNAAAAGVALPPQGGTNFLAPLTAVDNPTLGTTDVGLANGGLPAPGTNGNVLTDNGVAWVSSTPPKFVRYTPLDASDIICWQLNAGALSQAGNNGGTTPNTGNGGALSLAMNTATPGIYPVTGLFGDALQFTGGGGGGLSTAATSVQPTGNALTMSVWVCPQNLSPGPNAVFVEKNYHLTTLASPYTSLFLGQQSASGGGWSAGAVIGGSGVGGNIATGAGSPYNLVAGQWNLVSMTMDGTSLRAYLNGYLAATFAAVGSVDYGSNGPYGVGCVPIAAGGSTPYSMIQEIRIASTVRSAAYLQQMYKYGLNLSD